MMLNKSKGNMYPFVTHTWNTIKGKCPHDCEYCYMKRFKQKDVRLDLKEFKTDLGEGNFIFVGSSCDMWAEPINHKAISMTLGYAGQFKNKYLFQTKNPERILDFTPWIPENSIFGTTIETNRIYRQMGITPDPLSRAAHMKVVSAKFQTMVTVEPAMDFDTLELITLIELCRPSWVNIGADSKGHCLPEPGAEKLKALIRHFEVTGTEVKVKSNLKRLIGEFPK